MFKTRICVATVCALALASTASATLFDFSTIDRTFLGGPDSTVPDASDFVPAPGYPDMLLLVGSLTNGCGVFASTDGTISRSGTTCGDPSPGPVRHIRFDTGSDTFTLGSDTAAQLQIIVKVGHPEVGSPFRDQNQREEFRMFLEDPAGGTVEVTNFLDDVDSTSGDEDDAYYRYVYDPGVVPAGTWFPTMTGTFGSIDYLVQLKAVPEPASAALILSGLALVGLAARRRRV